MYKSVNILSSIIIQVIKDRCSNQLYPVQTNTFVCVSNKTTTKSPKRDRQSHLEKGRDKTKHVQPVNSTILFQNVHIETDSVQSKLINSDGDKVRFLLQ